MGQPKRVGTRTGDGEYSGVAVEYTRSRRDICMWGWYDTYGGIECVEMSLGDFLRGLGITLDDCRKALGEK